MNYYETLVHEVEKSMKAHPRSTLVMDSDSFKIIAKGNHKSVARQLSARKKSKSTSVIFQRPRDNAVWVLALKKAPCF